MNACVGRWGCQKSATQSIRLAQVVVDGQGVKEDTGKRIGTCGASTQTQAGNKKLTSLDLPFFFLAPRSSKAIARLSEGEEG